MTSIAMHLPKRLPAASIPNADMVQAGQYRLLIGLQSGQIGEMRSHRCLAVAVPTVMGRQSG